MAAGGATVYPFDLEALKTMVEWMRRYTQMPRRQMDLADVSLVWLVWLAHDIGVVRIMTTDLHDFSRYRLPNGRAFETL